MAKNNKETTQTQTCYELEAAVTLVSLTTLKRWPKKSLSLTKIGSWTLQKMRMSDETNILFLGYTKHSYVGGGKGEAKVSYP